MQNVNKYVKKMALSRNIHQVVNRYIQPTSGLSGEWLFLYPPIASLHWGLLTFRPAVCHFYLTQGFATEPFNVPVKQ
jgi:hypothetical protein